MRLEVFDGAGQSRGRILLKPSYLKGEVFYKICLSAAKEPPLVIAYTSDARVTCRTGEGAPVS